MDTTVRDKFLTEAMGEKYYSHEVAHVEFSKYRCSCGASWDAYALEEPDHCTPVPTDFSEWDGFGNLWNWAHKQEWFRLFLVDTGSMHSVDSLKLSVVSANFISPDTFADAIYEYLVESV